MFFSGTRQLKELGLYQKLSKFRIYLEICFQNRNTHQFLYFTFKVLNAVKLSLTTALCSNSIFTSPSNIMDTIQFFRCQFVHFQEWLKVISWKWNYLLRVQWQLYLESRYSVRLNFTQQRNWHVPLGFENRTHDPVQPLKWPLNVWLPRLAMADENSSPITYILHSQFIWRLRRTRITNFKLCLLTSVNCTLIL